MSSLFDILGPVMVGPSSSHTAGAVRIGLITRKLLQEEIIFADIGFYGSFAATYHGHGTDRAIIAGLLGMQTDDERIPFSLKIAKDNGLKIYFYCSGKKWQTYCCSSLFYRWWSYYG